ncbi:MAG: thiamine-phosphate pyrophosphorylase, partial [Candidatus Omnitrophota bacterium]
MFNKKALYRIIDANLNRTREGLRVCEEILRFVLNDKKTTLEFKKIRQQIKKITDILLIEKLLKARDIE